MCDPKFICIMHFSHSTLNNNKNNKCNVVYNECPYNTLIFHSSILITVKYKGFVRKWEDTKLLYLTLDFFYEYFILCTSIFLKYICDTKMWLFFLNLNNAFFCFSQQIIFPKIGKFFFFFFYFKTFIKFMFKCSYLEFQ